MNTSEAPQRYCRSCGKPEHGSIACAVAAGDIFGIDPNTNPEFQHELHKAMKELSEGLPKAFHAEVLGARIIR